MKLHYLIAACVIVLLTGCNKHKMRQCSYTYEHVPTGIAMAGFDNTELHTINVRQYVPDSTFTQLLSDTTIVSDSLYYQHDTVFRGPRQHFFAEIREGKQYEIEVPAASRTFRINGIFYNGQDKHYYQSEDCRYSTVGTFVRGADSAVVDGMPYATTPYSPITYLTLIK